MFAAINDEVGQALLENSLRQQHEQDELDRLGQQGGEPRRALRLPKEPLSRELRLEAALSQYLRGLELQRNQDLSGARALYEELVRQPLLRETLPPVSDIQGSGIHALQFAVNKNLGMVLVGLGLAMHRDGRAAVHLQRALEIDASDFECNLALAAVAQQRSDMDLAYTCLRRCVSHACTWPQMLEARSKLAQLLFDLADASECLEVIRQILAMDPDNADAQAIHNTIMLEFIEGSSLTSRLEKFADPAAIFKLELERSKGPIATRKRNRPVPSGRFDIPRSQCTLRLSKSLDWVSLAKSLCEILSLVLGLDLTTPLSIPWRIEFYDDGSVDAVAADTIQDALSRLDDDDEGASATENDDTVPRKRSRQETARYANALLADEPASAKGLGQVNLSSTNRYVPTELRLDREFRSPKSNAALSTTSATATLIRQRLWYYYTTPRRKSQKSTRPTASTNGGHRQIGTGNTAQRAAHPCFSDPKLVVEFVKSLGGTATLAQLVSRFVANTVVGNTALGLPGRRSCQWPQALADLLAALVAGIEELGFPSSSLAQDHPDLRCDDATQKQNGLPQVEYCLSLAEALMEPCERKIQDENSRLDSDSNDAGDEGFARDNSLVDTSITSIFARLMAVIHSTSAMVFELRPDIRVRALWLCARYARAQDENDKLREYLALCRDCIEDSVQPDGGAADEPGSEPVDDFSQQRITLADVQVLMDHAAAHELLVQIDSWASDSSKSTQVASTLLVILLPEHAKDAGASAPAADSVCAAARQMIAQNAAPQKRLVYLERAQQALAALDRSAELERLQPIILGEYLQAVLSDDDSADTVASKIPELIASLGRLAQNQVSKAVEMLVSHDASAVAAAFAGVLDELAPLAHLLARVAWQLMVAVSDSDNSSGSKLSGEPRKTIGKFIVHSWIFFVSVLRLWNAANLDSASTTKPTESHIAHAVKPQPKPDGDVDTDMADGDAGAETPRKTRRTSAASSDHADRPSMDQSSSAASTDKSSDDESEETSDSSSGSSGSDDESSSEAVDSAEARDGVSNSNAPVAAAKGTQKREKTRSKTRDAAARQERHLVKLAGWIHDQVGEIFLCGSDGAALLKFMMSILSNLDYETYHVYTNQCYACMYGLVIKLDRETIYEHECPPLPFEKQAATQIFELFSPYILGKLSTGVHRSITYDIRDCFEQICQVLGDVASQNVHVRHNRRLISMYLESDVDPAAMSPTSRQPLGVLDLEHSAKIPNAFRTLFYIGGAIIWAQFNAKWTNSFKGQEAYDELELQAGQLIKHLSVVPSDIDAWILLGRCYCALADELLNWSASKIHQSKTMIIRNQRRGYNCLRQQVLWKTMGLLCQAIVGKPMSSAALSADTYQIKELWKKRSLDPSKASEPFVRVAPELALKKMSSHMLSVSLFCTRKALVAEHKNWLLHFHLGTLYRKLGRIGEAIDALLKAAELMPREPGPKDSDRVLEPLIKLADTLCKEYNEKRMDSDAVTRVLTRLYEIMPYGEGSPSAAPATLPGDESNAVFQQLVSLLGLIRALDKRKTQHKPVYRQAWIHYHVYKDPLAAKTELLNLFQLRTNSKTLKTIWKTDHERPGKHYVYVHKYTLFAIELAHKTSDTVLLRQLYRRILKAEEVCLHRDVLLNEIRSGFCQRAALEPAASDGARMRWVGRMARDPAQSAALDEIDRQIARQIQPEVESLAMRMLFAAELKRDRIQDSALEAALDALIAGAYADLCWNAMGRPEAAADEGAAASAERPDSVTMAVVVQRAQALSKNAAQ
ncbi:Histone transcription regulator 3 [Polyrhizophydium stewartii]|uniref:Histone transcription regulator 3 n=1 Tax=Polyrhizophydium stewartii TaxID=2732419 RepID=A0ABR4N4B9_9FUNG